jgi:diguanylate cyclase (GGDEF)-like protein
MIIICSVIDISHKERYFNGLLEEKKKLSKDNVRLGRLANDDAVTGLYNRRAFDRLLLNNLSSAREAKDSISIIMADIDYFKKFNDKLGHPLGDLLLRDLGHVLTKNVRKEDTVARVGGEEFAVILPGTHYDDVAGFGERLRSVVELESWKAEPITLSLGATTYQFKSKRTGIKRIMKQVIEEADQALYQAKRAGRNRFIHFVDVPAQSKTAGA